MDVVAAVHGKTHRWGGGFTTSRPRPLFQPPGASPADSPRVYLTTMALLDHRPCGMIAESGAPPPSIRRASPTRPLWLLKPSPKPAACAAALTRRLFVLAVIPKTDGPASP